MAKKDKKKQETNGAKPQPPPSRLARHQPFYERLLFVVALLGVLVTIHLTLWYGAATVPNDDPVCGFGFDCTAVLASDPMPLGIPSAVWGLLFYLGMAGLCAGIVYFADAKRLLLKKIRVGMVGIGFLYSLFLTAYQFVVLPERCSLCLISALLVATLFAAQAVYLFKPVTLSTVTMKAKTRKREGALYGVLTVLILLFTGADVAYFNSLVPPVAAQTTQTQTAQQVAGTQPAGSGGQCLYDPQKAAVEDLSTLIDESDPDTGNPDASVTVIEVFDPNCPHCKSLHPIMKSIVAQYADQVRFVYKPITLPQFPYSKLQNAVLFAADEEGKFTEMLDLQFKWQQRGGLTGARLKELATMIGIDPDAMEQRITEGRYNDLIQRSNKQAVDAGVSGVPAVLINGRFITSASRTEACLSQFIEEALRNDEPGG